MVIPILRNIILNDKAPKNIDYFAIGAIAEITTEGNTGADDFAFGIITPQKLMAITKNGKMVFGKATFIVNEANMRLNMELIEDEIKKILLKCSRETWEETALAINYYLDWEYYNPSVGVSEFYLQSLNLKKQTFYVKQSD